MSTLAALLARKALRRESGRMGRLQQTLILSRWNPIPAWVPVESVIRHRQTEYYAALAAPDEAEPPLHFPNSFLPPCWT